MKNHLELGQRIARQADQLVAKRFHEILGIPADEYRAGLQVPADAAIPTETQMHPHPLLVDPRVSLKDLTTHFIGVGAFRPRIVTIGLLENGINGLTDLNGNPIVEQANPYIAFVDFGRDYGTNDFNVAVERFTQNSVGITPLEGVALQLQYGSKLQKEDYNIVLGGARGRCCDLDRGIDGIGLVSAGEAIKMGTHSMGYLLDRRPGGVVTRAKDIVVLGSVK